MVSTLTEQSREALSRTIGDELAGSLLLRFFASEPDVRVVLPKVPG